MIESGCLAGNKTYAWSDMGLRDFPIEQGISEGKKLLEACFKGEKEAWEIFVRTYSPVIYNSLKTTIKNKSFSCREEDVEDLHNEVFLSLIKDNFRKLRSYDGRNGCTLAHWLKVVAIRTAIDFLRSQRVSQAFSSSEGSERPEVDQFCAPQESADESLERKEVIKILQKAISKLPPNDQLFIELVYYKELTFQEISQFLNISIDSVYARHNYLKEKMRDKVKKFFS